MHWPLQWAAFSTRSCGCAVPSCVCLSRLRRQFHQHCVRLLLRHHNSRQLPSCLQLFAARACSTDRHCCCRRCATSSACLSHLLAPHRVIPSPLFPLPAALAHACSFLFFIITESVPPVAVFFVMMKCRRQTPGQGQGPQQIAAAAAAPALNNGGYTAPGSSGGFLSALFPSRAQRVAVAGGGGVRIPGYRYAPVPDNTRFGLQA